MGDYLSRALSAERRGSVRYIGDAGENLTADEVEFGAAMDRYKRDNCQPFPDCAEVLAVAKSLGYRKE